MIKFYTFIRKSFSEIGDDLHVVYGDSCQSNGAVSKNGWQRNK